MAGTSGTSAKDVVIAVTGSREAGYEAACRLYCGPEVLRFGQSAVGKSRRLPTGDGTSLIFRAIAGVSHALVAALLPNECADVTRDLLGRQRQAQGLLNNIRHPRRAPGYGQRAFTVQSGHTNRLWITFAR
jgi:hypothetical protein